jgi:hypothetical protein
VRQQQEEEASEAWLRSDRRVPWRKKLRDVKESDCSLAQSQLFTCLQLLWGDSTEMSLGYLKNGLHALKPKIQNTILQQKLFNQRITFIPLRNNGNTPHTPDGLKTDPTTHTCHFLEIQYYMIFQSAA